MKRMLIISCAIALMGNCAGVAYASDVGVEKVSKKEFIKSEPVQLSEMFGEMTPLQAFSATVPSAIDYHAPLNVIYITKNVMLYFQPDVDRKWVWWYSITNDK